MKSKTFRIATVAGAALMLSVPVPAHAQKTPVPAEASKPAPAPAASAPEQLPDRYDNVLAGVSGAFKSLDADGDGMVSKGEFSKAVTGQFSRLDTNRNGVLDPDEFSVTNRQQFKRLDQNKDDMLSEEEFAPVAEKYQNPELKALEEQQLKEVRELAIRHQKERESLESQLKGKKAK